MDFYGFIPLKISKIANIFVKEMTKTYKAIANRMWTFHQRNLKHSTVQQKYYIAYT